MGNPIVTVRQSEASIEEMRALFAKQPELVTKAVQSGVSRAAGIIKARVISNISSKFKILTGNLLMSPRMKRQKSPAGVTSVGIFLNRKAFYGVFLEQGLTVERKKMQWGKLFADYVEGKRKRIRKRKKPFHLEAKPFFEPAAADVNQVAEEQIRLAVTRALARA